MRLFGPLRALLRPDGSPIGSYSPAVKTQANRQRGRHQGTRELARRARKLRLDDSLTRDPQTSIEVQHFIDTGEKPLKEEG